MRLKRRTKANIHSNDQDSQKSMAVRTDYIASTSEMRKDVRSVDVKLDGFKQGSKIRMKRHKLSAHKITKCMTDSLVFSGSNTEMKKFQIILTRCDDKDFNLLNESVVVFNNNSREYDGIKSKYKTGKERLKNNSKKNVKEKKNILEVTDNVQKDDIEICHASMNNSGLSEIKSNSLKRSKRNRENIGEIDIHSEEIEIAIHSKNKFRNGDVKRELKVNLEKYISIPENDESLKLCGGLESSVDADKKAKNVPNETGKSRKRKKGGEKQDENDAKPAKSAKKAKDSDKSKSSEEKTHDVASIDFSNDSKNSSGKKWNFKISSWNVNGIRAWLEKGSLSYLHHEKPDIICIQETKCSDDKLPEEVKKVEGYHSYWLSGDKDGYSGVGLLSKQEPIKVEYGIGISEHDNEGRVITAEYEQFYIVASYVPNAGRKLVRLEYRMKWDENFRAYLKKLDAKKPVILCGDLNVAHEEIDLANPKTNKKNAGFTKEEREGFSTLLKEGFTDTFRHLYPDVTGAYTFWTYMMNARAKNVGWRLDYFVISERFTEKLCDSVIRKDVLGSDHCPITLFLSV